MHAYTVTVSHKSKVKQFMMNGWTATENLPPEFQPFVKRKYELNNCLLWGGRVVVPLKLRDNFYKSFM